MKKTIYFLIIIAIVVGTYYFTRKEVSVSPMETTKTYRDTQINLSFVYPKILTASTTDNIVTLHHDIAYQNTGACDMMGDEKTYDRLTDFEMTVQVVDKGLTDTAKQMSPYIPQENFVNGELIASPGFIDPYTIGTLSGFAIYEGAEGCGRTTYYFEVESQKTLVVTNASIQILSGVISGEKVAEVLAIPGVISKDQNKEILENILKSLSI